MSRNSAFPPSAGDFLLASKRCEITVLQQLQVSQSAAMDTFNNIIHSLAEARCLLEVDYVDCVPQQARESYAVFVATPLGEARGLTEEEAHRLLLRMVMNQNKRLIEISNAMLVDIIPCVEDTP